MPPRKKGRNKINGDDADEIVDLISQLTDGLQDMEIKQVQGVFFGRDRYGFIRAVDIEYKTEIEVERPNGKKVTREATISTSVEIQKVPENARLAPFEIVNGLIAPAELDRFDIIKILEDNDIHYKNPPLFTISDNLYLVYAEKYLIVNTKDKTVQEATTLEELDKFIKPMFTYQSRKIKAVYE